MDSLFTISNIHKLSELFIVSEETLVVSKDIINYEKLLKLLPNYNSSRTSYYIYENNNLILYDVNKKWFRDQYVLKENTFYDIKIKNIFQDQNLLKLVNQYVISDNTTLRYQIREAVLKLEYLK